MELADIYKSLFVATVTNKEVIAYKSWNVRWKTVHHRGAWSSLSFVDTHENMEIFPTPEAANDFKTALVLANKQLRNSGSFNVTITSNQ